MGIPLGPRLEGEKAGDCAVGCPGCKGAGDPGAEPTALPAVLTEVAAEGEEGSVKGDATRAPAVKSGLRTGC